MSKKEKSIRRVEDRQPGQTLGQQTPMAEFQKAARQKLDAFLERSTQHVKLIRWMPAGLWRYTFDDEHEEEIEDDFGILGETADSIMRAVQQRNPGVTVQDDRVS